MFFVRPFVLSSDGSVCNGSFFPRTTQPLSNCHELRPRQYLRKLHFGDTIKGMLICFFTVAQINQMDLNGPINPFFMSASSLFIYLSTYLSLYRSIHPSIHPSTYLPTYLPTFLPAYLLICQSLYPSISSTCATASAIERWSTDHVRMQDSPG